MEELIGYVSVAEANKYIENNYRREHPLNCIWQVLDNDQKKIYLKKSLIQLETLHYIGFPLRKYQTLKFPRTMRYGATGSYIHNPYPENIATVPDAIKHAQIENALGIINDECLEFSQKRAKFLESVGVKVVTIPDEKKPKKPLSSSIALQLISRWRTTTVKF